MVHLEKMLFKCIIIIIIIIVIVVVIVIVIIIKGFKMLKSFCKFNDRKLSTTLKYFDFNPINIFHLLVLEK